MPSAGVCFHEARRVWEGEDGPDKVEVGEMSLEKQVEVEFGNFATALRENAERIQTAINSSKESARTLDPLQVAWQNALSLLQESDLHSNPKKMERTVAAFIYACSAFDQRDLPIDVKNSNGVPGSIYTLSGELHAKILKLQRSENQLLSFELSSFEFSETDRRAIMMERIDGDACNLIASMPDVNLRGAILRQLDKKPDSRYVSKKDLGGMRDFIASGQNISDLTGVFSLLPNLRELYAPDNKITSIPLEINESKLSALMLQGNNLQDVPPLPQTVIKVALHRNSNLNTVVKQTGNLISFWGDIEKNNPVDFLKQESYQESNFPLENIQAFKFEKGLVTQMKVSGEWRNVVVEAENKIALEKGK